MQHVCQGEHHLLAVSVQSLVYQVRGKHYLWCWCHSRMGTPKKCVSEPHCPSM